ncbi:glycoside hydrolase family protein [Arthrobacter pigmenti]
MPEQARTCRLWERAFSATYATNETVQTLAYGTNLEATDTVVSSWVPDVQTLTGQALANAYAAISRNGKRAVGQDELIVNVFDHGAVGDGVVDDTLAWEEAVAVVAANGSGTVIGKGAKFLVSRVDFGVSNLTVVGARFLAIPTDTDIDFHNPVTVNFAADNVERENLTFMNVHVDGQRHLQSGLTGVENGARQGWRIRGRVRNLRAFDCSGINCGSTGIALLPTSALAVNGEPTMREVYFTRCNFSGNRFHGGAAAGAENVRFIDCKFNDNGNDIGPAEGEQGYRFNGNLFANGFDGEEYGDWSYLGDVWFINCEAVRNARGGLLMYQTDNDPTAADWVERDGYHFIGCVADDGTTGAGYAISLTPSGAAIPTGDFYHFDNVNIVNCQLKGSLKLASVRNSRHTGGSSVPTTLATIGFGQHVEHVYLSGVDRAGVGYSVAVGSEGRIEYADSPGSLWVPAAALASVTGTPTRAEVGYHDCWLFSDGQYDRVGGTADIPDDWREINIDVVWFNAAATSGDVQWGPGLGDALVAGGTVATPSVFSGTTGVGGAQNIIMETRVVTAAEATGGAVPITLVRAAPNALDTLAGDAGLLGLRITRAA